MQPLFGGYYRDNNWVTLEIYLHNGPQAWTGEVRATLPYGQQNNYTFSQSVNLAANAESRFFFYILPTRYEPQFDIGLFGADGEQVASQPLRLQSLNTADYLIGVLADPDNLKNPSDLPAGGIIKVRQTDARTIFVPVLPEKLPDRSAGLTSLNSLLIGNLDPTRLSQEQWRSVLGWVEEGGRLWLSGGPALAKVSAALDPTLLPAVSQGLTTLNRVVGQSLPNTILPSVQLPGGKPISLQRLEVSSGAEIRIVDASGLPLVTGLALGKGSLVVAAFDLISPPFNRSGETGTYWSGLVDASSPGPEHLSLRQSLFEMSDLPRRLWSEPGLEMPNPLWFLAGLWLYVLVVAPATYLLFQRMARPGRAILLTLVVFLGAGGVVWGVGMSVGAGQVRLNQASIITYYSNNVPASLTTMGVSTGAGNTNYDFNAGNSFANWLFRPQRFVLASTDIQAAPPRTFVQTGSNGAVQLQSNLSNGDQVQVFAGQGTIESRFTFEANLAVMPDGTGLTGTILNTSNWNLTDVTLVLGDNYLYLGDLATGEQRRVNFPLKNQLNFLPRPNVEASLYDATVAGSENILPTANLEQWQRNLRWTTLNTAYLNGRFATIYQNYSLYLTGWLDGKNLASLTGAAPLGSEAKIKRQNFALLIKPIPFSYQPAGNSSQLIIPAPTLSPERLSATKTTADPATGSFKLGAGGSMLLQYRLPPQVKLQPTRLSLLIKAERDTGSVTPTLPQLEIYDWLRQSWDLILEQPNARNRIDLTGPNVSNYLEPLGQFIRLRVSATTSDYTLQQLNLEIEGVTPSHG